MALPGPDAIPESEPSGETISVAYRRYALGQLLVVYVFNFFDRSILNILVEDIKRDLELSDTAIGFLTGIAFALVYTVNGIPVARWADVGVRRSIIALGLFVWSGMTAVCGLAQNFWQLAAARFGVGLGESACSPPAHSLLSDYFPPERRATALSIYALGIPIGSALGTFSGGWINELFDWRTAFLVVGLPGVLLALVVRLTLREPPRGYSDRATTPATAPAASDRTEPLGDVLRFMLSLRSFRHFSFAAALHAFYGYGAGVFVFPFFIRVHGFDTGELGTWLALLGLTFGAAGTYLGGRLGDALAIRDQRWYLWLPALATLVGIPFSAVLYLYPDPYIALVLYAPGAALGAMYLGPTFAMTQAIVRPRMRALAAAILLFIINLIGLGLGPQLTGILSDLLAPSYGVESVRYALLIVVCGGAAWSSVHYLIASWTLIADLRKRDEPRRDS